MVNQKTLDLLFGVPEMQEEEELSHHGVLGQTWGEMHGPPYPLRGVDKKIARAEARKKKEKERRLKKLQRAAKKARKLKKKEEKKAADIQKLKQKLVREGDMTKIKKNINLFTNEELAYINEREMQKKTIKDRKELETDEKMELFMKRFNQVATLAASAQQVALAAKAGADAVAAFKGARIKDLEADEKRMKRIKDEFETRYKIDPEDAKAFFEAESGGEKYNKESKASKLEKKADEAQRAFDAKAKLEGIKKAEQELKGPSKKELKEQKKQQKIDAQGRADLQTAVTNMDKLMRSIQGQKANDISQQSIDAGKRIFNTNKDALKGKTIKLSGRTSWATTQQKPADNVNNDVHRITLSDLGSNPSTKSGKSWMSSIQTASTVSMNTLSALDDRNKYDVNALIRKIGVI